VQELDGKDLVNLVRALAVSQHQSPRTADLLDAVVQVLAKPSFLGPFLRPPNMVALFVVHICFVNRGVSVSAVCLAQSSRAGLRVRKRQDIKSKPVETQLMRQLQESNLLPPGDCFERLPLSQHCA
jgi:hypothetical protein